MNRWAWVGPDWVGGEEDQGGETSEEEERNEAIQAFDYPENMSKDEASSLTLAVDRSDSLLFYR